MIWFTLALFAVSFLITALLAPKPEFENARPEDLDPNNFPQATEDAPVALLLGCARIAGPNTLWYGDFRSKPIKEKMKTGLFSSTKVTVGYNYYLSIDLGICLGPNVQLKKIYIDDEVVAEGDTLYPEQVQTYHEDLTMSISSSSLVYEETDILAVTGLTAEQYDNLASAGDLQLEAIIDFDTEKTPLAGGGPSSGSFTLSAIMHSVSGDPFGSPVNPVEGALAVQDTENGDTINEVMKVNYTLAPGARYLSVAAQLSPTLPLFTIITVNSQTYTIKGFGEVIDTVSSDINEPKLYGGKKSGGGHVGDFTFYAGKFDQDVDPNLESSIGVGLVPAYNGVCHIVMPNQWIGETPALRKTEFLVGKYSNYLNLPFLGHIALDHPDINPAGALYHMAVDGWSGLGLETANLNFQSFYDAGVTLIAEGHGCSIKVTSSQTGKKIFQEVLRQIDGVLSQNSVGEIELKLIRDDYTVGTLPIYDEDDIIEVTSFTKTSWQDLKSVVKVSFASREKEGTRVAEAQNMAVANMVGKSTSEISFPFCYDKTIANQLAARELSVLSFPLLRLTCTMNRNAFDLELGAPIKVSIPEYGVTELVCRVQNLDLGQIDDNKISVELVQDIFAVSTVVFSDPEDTGWSDDRPEPEAIVTSDIVDMPYFFGSNLEDPVFDGFGAVIPFTVSPKAASDSFDMVSGTTTGVLDIWEPQQVLHSLSGKLSAMYENTEGFLTGVDATGFTINTIIGADGSDPIAATVAQIQSGEAGILYVDGEWMGYEGVTDNMDGTFTLTNVHRGLLGTVPITHALDTIVYFFDVSLLSLSTIGAELLEDGTIYYKLLDRVGGSAQGESEVTESSYVLQDVADRPLRPRNLQYGGDRILPKLAAGSQNLSWVNSNRTEGQISLELDADETPDKVETYDLEVWVDGVEEVSLSASSVTSPVAVDFTGIVGSVADIRLYARRTTGDTKSSLYYGWFPVTLGSAEKLSGDMNSGNDLLLTSGDQQSGGDTVTLSGDEA